MLQKVEHDKIHPDKTWKLVNHKYMFFFLFFNVKKIITDLQNRSKEFWIFKLSF